MSDTSQGTDWWLASDGKWYPPQSATAAPPPPPPPTGKKKADPKTVKRTRIGCLSVFVIVALIVIITIVASSGGGGGSVQPHVTSVGPLDSSTVRIYINWENTGSAAASASCVINTTVHNQFGDEVKIEVNSTSTNGNVAAHGNQLLYQDIGVNSGDAQYVTKSDVSVTDC